MSWTFWNLLILTVDCTTRPRQGKQLPSQNNKLLSRVYLRIIYFPNSFSTLFANSELPNDTSCLVLNSLPHWETHALIQIFVFLLYSLLRCSQDSRMVIFLLQRAVDMALLHSCLGRIASKEIIFCRVFWPQTLDLVKLFLLLFYIGQDANLSHFLLFDSAPAAGTNTVFSQSTYIEGCALTQFTIPTSIRQMGCPPLPQN